MYFQRRSNPSIPRDIIISRKPVVPVQQPIINNLNVTQGDRINENLYSSVNVSIKNKLVQPAPEDGFALEQNILELFITEIDDKILIPE
jgi:hypothetical protein